VVVFEIEVEIIMSRNKRRMKKPLALFTDFKYCILMDSRLRPWSESSNVQHLNEIKPLLLHKYKITTNKETAFFTPTLDHLGSPWDMADMGKAVSRIITGIQKGERIMIFGDFDADGIMSTAQLYDGLRKMGAKVSYRIPDRMKDSHGLKKYIIDDISEAKVKLIITCDCGINDHEEVSHAKELGIDVIITDHHMPDKSREPKNAYAIINPHQERCQYPYKDLSGSVVAFKLICALAEKGLPDADAIREFILPYFELATIGLISDCMPLTGENRTFAQFGLGLLQNSNWEGLRRIFAKNNLDAGQIDEQTIGFTVAPLLNAASRLSHAHLAVRLFTSDQNKIGQYLKDLESLNDHRKLLTQTYMEQAQTMIVEDSPCQILVHKGWHPGILGLIAGRITEQLQVPVIAVTYDEKSGDNPIAGASCRAPEGYNLAEALVSVGDHMLNHGGHEGAAGFRCNASELIQIEEKLQKYWKESTAEKSPISITGTLNPDLLTPDFAIALRPYKPFGMGMDTPIWRINKGIVTEVRMVGKNKNHAQIFVQLGTKTHKMMYFFAAEKAKKIQVRKPYNMLIEISDQWWKGEHQLSIKIVDIRKAR